MPHLFDPLTLRGVTIRNRIGMAPMCQYSTSGDGIPTDWHIAHYGARAAGGVGLILLEATAVEARGRITPGDLGIWSDDHIEPLARLARFIKSQGATPGIQIGHAGRKAGTARPWEGGHPLSDEQGGWEIVAPSAIPFDQGYRIPHELTLAQIAEVQAAFRAAARRVREAGFDVLELHGAHGYLIHSFHSPISNQRTDQYGGSFENRIRFTLETVAAIRQEWPEDKPLLVRLSCTDWLAGGWVVEEATELARRLKKIGVDLIDCSSGGSRADARPPLGPGYQVPLSETVRAGADIPTATVGLITAPTHADEIIRNSRADLVLLGRELLRNPYWPIQAALALGQRDDAPIPAQYRRGY